MTFHIHDDKVFIFGGVGNDGAQNDVQVLSLGYLADEVSSGVSVGSLPNDDIISPTVFSILQ